MATMNIADRVDPRMNSIVIRFLVVSLIVATAAIHASLGGMMFLATAVGYATLAVAMIAPGPIAQIRWLVRVALLGFTASTIGGWLLFGTRFPLAYLDKGIEVALVAVVAFELWRQDGGPIGIARLIRRLVGRLAGAERARARR
jgi:hypothetical protein